MKKIRLTITIIFCIAFADYHLFAQTKEGNIWYFGANAGIDFNQTPPVALTDGRMNTVEGCASMADVNGNLLFYTNGQTIWNSTHAIMPNGTGLMGDGSSTQSALIVKQPMSETIYYVFTVDELRFALGNLIVKDWFRYSLVDMSLNGGLGDVDPIQKNILVVDTVGEKLTAVRHQNGCDFWIVVHKFGSNAFYSYLLSSTGLSTIPVVSSVGSIINSNDGIRGYLKASPDGSRIASVNGFNTNTELFNFDNSTGKISDPILIPMQLGFPQVYGVEFSPNSKLLYISGPRSLDQFDLTAANVIGSRVTISTFSLGIVTVQLAPDNKIYVSQENHNYLHVIESPNEDGADCDFRNNKLYLSGRQSLRGLPNFVNSTFNNASSSFTSSDLCLMDSTSFTMSTSLTVDSVLWDFGDPSSGINNTSKDISPKHVYTHEGDFEVTLVVFSLCIIDTVRDSLSIMNVMVDLGNDTTLCQGATLTLDATTAGATYNWQNGASTDSTFNVTESDRYGVEVMINGCSGTDSINVNFNPLPIVNLGNDTMLCPGETRTLDATTANASSYLWQDASTNPTFDVIGPDSYGVEVMVSDCNGTDSVEVGFNPLFIVNLGNDTMLCLGATLTLDAATRGATYVWQDGSTFPTFNVTDSGTYWVEVTSNCGTANDTLSVLFEDCTCNISFPNSFTPNSDNKNDRFSPVTNCEFREYNFVILNRSGQKIFETNDYNDSWDGTYKGSLCPVGIYVYDIGYVFERLSLSQNRRVFQEKQGRLMLLR